MGKQIKALKTNLLFILIMIALVLAYLLWRLRGSRSDEEQERKKHAGGGATRRYFNALKAAVSRR